MFIKIGSLPERLYLEEPIISEFGKNVEYIDVYAIKIYKQDTIDDIPETYVEVWYLKSNQIPCSETDKIGPYADSENMYNSKEFCELIQRYLRNIHELIFEEDLNWTEEGLQTFSQPESTYCKWPLNEKETTLFLESGLVFLEKAHLISGLWR